METWAWWMGTRGLIAIGVLTLGCGGETTAPARDESGGGGAVGLDHAVSPGGAAAVVSSSLQLEKTSACDGERVVDFVHNKAAHLGDLGGFENRVVVDGDRGFLLFGPNDEGFMRLSPQGDYLGLLPAPYDTDAYPTHGVVAVDGSLFVAGWLSNGGVGHAWFAKLDADWHLSWERELDETVDIRRADIEPLPDGGAVVVGAAQPGAYPDFDTGNDDAFVARLGADGAVLWQRPLSFARTHRFSAAQGMRMLAVDARGIHLAVPTDAGVFLVGTDLDGVVDEESTSIAVPESVRSFQRLGYQEAIGVEALPDAELAVYSTHRLAILGAAGKLRVQHDLSDSHYISAVRFDSARNQLVIVGSYDDVTLGELPAPWVRAIDLDGELAWEMQRPALSLSSSDAFGGPDGSGPPLHDAAIDGFGNMLLPGHIARGLEYAWIGSEECAE